ncbi:hypothetical protein TNCV_3722481 [Trichonephila clavipes]|nr:hypothetical protein TNCV_3722481 [Trichonephila clavipes]
MALRFSASDTMMEGPTLPEKEKKIRRKVCTFDDNALLAILRFKYFLIFLSGPPDSDSRNRFLPSPRISA